MPCHRERERERERERNSRLHPNEGEESDMLFQEMIVTLIRHICIFLLIKD